MLTRRSRKSPPNRPPWEEADYLPRFSPFPIFRAPEWQISCFLFVRIGTERMDFMSENKSGPPAVDAAARVEQLKLQIAQSLKKRQSAAAGSPGESVLRAEQVLNQVRARLSGGQTVQAGQSAVRQWMDADTEKPG